MLHNTNELDSTPFIQLRFNTVPAAWAFSYSMFIRITSQNLVLDNGCAPSIYLFCHQFHWNRIFGYLNQSKNSTIWTRHKKKQVENYSMYLFEIVHFIRSNFISNIQTVHHHHHHHHNIIMKIIIIICKWACVLYMRRHGKQNNNAIKRQMLARVNNRSMLR